MEDDEPSYAEPPLAPFFAFRCLRQSCGQLPHLLGQSCRSAAPSATPPFLRPPLPPPELRLIAPVVGPKLPLRRRPGLHQHPMRLPRLHDRCHPRGGGGGRHPPHFCCHSHGCSPRGRDCRCVAVSPGCVPQTLPPGFGQKTGSGASSWAISRSLTRVRVGAALVRPA